MAEYKNIFDKLAERVREAADADAVREVYAQGASRAKAFGQITKLTLELSGERDQLQKIYTEIGRLYYEQAQNAPEGPFVPLFEQADRVSAKIREKRAKIEELKEQSGVGQSDIEVEIGDFDDVVSATEADGASAERRP